MKSTYIILISVTSLLAAFLFFAIQQEWIIIRSPWSSNSEYQLPGLTKQNITFHYWSQHKAKQTTKELILSDDPSKRSEAIISGWLTHLHEEKVLKNKIILQSALLDQSGNLLYISFDQPILEKQESTREKVMLIKSLLLTLKENGVIAQGVYFLVNHKIMVDDQLDFDRSWVI